MGFVCGNFVHLLPKNCLFMLECVELEYKIPLIANNSKVCKYSDVQLVHIFKENFISLSYNF